MSTPLGVSPAEAARLLGLSRTTIYRLIKAKKLRMIKVGSRIVIPMKELDGLVLGRSSK
jgi:excisionase family DNA binding protein